MAYNRDPEEIETFLARKDVIPLANERRVEIRVEQLAEDIRAAYYGLTDAPLCVVVVLSGAFHFASTLLRALGGMNCEVEFVQASSYEYGTESSGVVHLRGPLPFVFKGKRVLIVDDIMDTGATLRKVIEYVCLGDAISVEACVLLSADEEMRRKLNVKYYGFQVRSASKTGRFFVGYGMDLGGKFRNMPGIVTVPVTEAAAKENNAADVEVDESCDQDE